MRCFQRTAKSLPVDFEIIIKKKKKALCFSAKCHQTSQQYSQKALLQAGAMHQKDKFPDLKTHLSHVCILAFVRSTFVMLLIP